MPRFQRLLVDRHLRQHECGLQLAGPLCQRPGNCSIANATCLTSGRGPWRARQSQVLDHHGSARAMAASDPGPLPPSFRLQHGGVGGRTRLPVTMPTPPARCRLPSQQHGLHGSQSDRRASYNYPAGNHHADHQRHGPDARISTTITRSRGITGRLRSSGATTRSRR